MLPEVAPKNRMRAQSHVATSWCARPNGPGRTNVSTLDAESPLVLKATRQKEPEPWPQLTGAARVSLTAGAAGPIGGDNYRLDVTVGAHSTLVFGDISPTLLLPGPGGAASSYEITIDVAEHGTLIWLAEPLIAAHGCNHSHAISVALDPFARLMMRDELVLGRHGESCGAVRQSVTVHRGGKILHRQDLTVGSGAAGYHGAAVLGRAGAVGSVLVVDPVWGSGPPPGHTISSSAALLPLAGPAVLITVVADDNLTLRRDLQAGLAHLGPPWQPTWPTR